MTNLLEVKRLVVKFSIETLNLRRVSNLGYQDFLIRSFPNYRFHLKLQHASFEILLINKCFHAYRIARGSVARTEKNV